MIEQLDEQFSPDKFSSVLEVIDYAAKEHAELPAFSCFSQTLDYATIDQLSSRFACMLQKTTNLKPGDRIAIQLPNLLQFPVAVYGALKAGLVVVNTNPLYTSKEMAHQFNDSGAKAVVILENFCDKLEEVIAETAIESVFITRLGDLQTPLKRTLINFGIKYIKKLVPSYHLPDAMAFLNLNNYAPQYFKPENPATANDVCVILYTGGTTGVSKGAMLSHRNLIANMMQFRSRCTNIIEDKIETIAAPLPLYHSYAFLLHCFSTPYAGNHSVLIPNPRDLDGLMKLIKGTVINGFVGINTLYLAMLRHKEFATIDWSNLKFCGAGGMAMTSSVLKEWQEKTGCEIYEGYGLTECSPVVSVNLRGRVKVGTVGPLVPGTEIKVVSDAGNEVEPGESGEAWIRGPQVMLGYWNRPEATADTITDDGWFKSGDYVSVDEEGFVKIVDRKKDMILVSGFNVFPNEIEDWVNSHPGVLESAAIGVANERTGEAVKLFVVLEDQKVTAEEIIAHSKKGLTAYKLPRQVVFVDDLPKSNIGKIIRRELRE
ncbi:MAG: AMP-binding protein [Pseudohongiellaceae bacterium]